MSRPVYRRLGVLLASAAAAYGAWRELPGTVVDRTVFATVMSRFVEPPVLIEGLGTPAQPWELRSLAAVEKPDSRLAPMMVTVGDDPEGFFQTSPPAPIDLAVIFKNFQRLGAKKAAAAMVMAWENPDPIGLVALEKALAVFDSLVLAAPLSRGAEPLPIPPAFRRASIPAASLTGDTLALPRVNRVPISGVILSGENSLAGFSQVESEPSSNSTALMAMWEDRVVFSFPLLVVLQRLDLPVAGLEIRLGEFLKLSPAGPIVRIDRHGRLVQPPTPLAPFAEISAQALITGGGDLLKTSAPEPLVLCDTRSTGEPRTQAFNQSLAGTVATLASPVTQTPRRVFPRLPVPWELALLGCVVLGLTLACTATDFWRNISLLILVGTVCGAQWLGVGLAAVWLPGLPLLASLLAAAVFAKLIKIHPRQVLLTDVPKAPLGAMPVAAVALQPRCVATAFREIPVTPAADEPPQKDGS